jgi:hypothetical protein
VPEIGDETEVAQIPGLSNTVPDPMEPEQNKVSSAILVPGHGQQYKGTLVSLLNDSVHLSHDRLVRVRHHKSRQNLDTYLEKGLNLFEDYAFQESTSFLIGRLQRMRVKGNTRGYIEYTEPVAFDDQQIKSLNITFQVYKHVNSDPQKLTLEGATVVEIKASKVFTQVNLTLDDDGGFYFLPETEHKHLCELVAQLNTSNTQTQKRQHSQDIAFDGVVRCTVPPASTTQGTRQSNRTRVTIQRLTY